MTQSFFSHERVPHDCEIKKMDNENDIPFLHTKSLRLLHFTRETLLKIYLFLIKIWKIAPKIFRHNSFIKANELIDRWRVRISAYATFSFIVY